MGQRREIEDMDLVGYCRVSTTEQQTCGYGLQLQERAIRNWAAAHGHRIVEVYSDLASGTVSSAERPGLGAALDALRPTPGATGLVVLNLDRVARELLQQEAVLQVAWRAGASVFAVGGGDEATGEVLADAPGAPTRKQIRCILGLVAEYERDLTAKRLVYERGGTAARGRRAGGRYAFGTRGQGKGKDRAAVPDENEQQVIARILDMRAAGLSYRQVGAALDAAGVPPRRADCWSAASIRLIAERARTSG